MIPRRDVRIYDKGLSKYLLLWIKDSDKKGYFFKFKENLKNYFSNENIFLVGGGRQSLHLIFDSMEFEKGDEIIVPNYYLKVLVPLISSKGLVPVFCDINKDDLSNNLESVLSKINEDTKFVILSHMFGLCQEIETFVEKVKEKKKDIVIIEDCAHAFGSEYNNKKLGTFGDFSFFSFNYIKNINTLEGGVLIVNNQKFINNITNNYNLYEFPGKLEIIKKIFYYYFLIIIIKTPFLIVLKCFLRNEKLKEIIKRKHSSLKKNHKKQKLSLFLSFLGYHQLNLFKQKQKKIESVLNNYKNKLNNNVWDKRFIGKNSKYSNYYLTILYSGDSRKAEKLLFKKGIDIGIKDEVMDLCKKNDDSKNSKDVFDRILQVPLYYTLKNKDIAKISKELNRII